jgi:hypothetical protein
LKLRITDPHNPELVVGRYFKTLLRTYNISKEFKGKMIDYVNNKTKFVVDTKGMEIKNENLYPLQQSS